MPAAASIQLADALARLAASRSLDELVEHLRGAARGLIGADGIAVVLRRGDRCAYVAEDALEALWAGQEFVIEACISGHAMMSGKTIVIPDIKKDPRVPQAAYAPTFVKSLVLAPIGNEAALGSYWASVAAPTAEHVAVADALAKAATAALGNIRLLSEAERSEAQLRAVLDSVQDCYYALDRNWRIIEFSRSSEEYFRLKRADVLGKVLWDIFPAGKDRPYGALLRTAMNERKSGRMEAPSAFRPGNTVEMRTAPMEGGVSVVITDITERRRAEADLRALSEELQAVLDAAPTAIWIAHNAEALQITGNKFAQHLLRLDDGANMSKSGPKAAATVGHFRVLGADGRELATHELPVQRAARGETVAAFEERVVFDDGAQVQLFGSAVPLLDRNGAPRGAVAAFADVTHLKEVEADLRELARDLETRIAAAVKDREAALNQLHESQKTESLGQIAGGVAHDFNNLLTPIIGGLTIVRRRVETDERAARLIDGALDAAERARILVQRMLAFARRQPLSPRPVSIPETMTSLATLLASSVGPRIALSFDIAPDTPPALADANQLELALLNLVVNARDAMPDGGRLTIAATRAPRRDRPPSEAWVRIAVTDTGVGMDEATLKRAVEPFFSTKGVGKGTGLGLSMAHGLAGQLGGALEISSTPRVGTTVELFLPVAHAAPEAAAAAAAEPKPAIGAVLLVDDEDLVRASTREMLEELGYSVSEASSAHAALTMLETGAAFDWCVTDHMMPGMTGADLARAVRQRRPGVKVLVISGYAGVDAIAPDLPRLAKPFRLEELGRLLAEE